MRRTPSAPRPSLALALALAALPGALVVSLPLHAAAAQQPAAGTGRVAGTVLGEGNRPVPGAQVLVVGTRLGAVTDDNGRFNVAGVPAGAQTVRVQRIGFTPRTQPVTVAAGQVATLDFTLTAAVTELTAVAVVGYTQEARRDISGAVTQVTGNDIRDQKVATVEEALRGRAPGVQIAATGQPGRPAQIIIRGQNGFNSPSPLYVVDGMYVGQQNPNINPDDIATINILKDASAAAQYGAQASNGVVVITTRRGQAGNTQFSVNSYFGFQDIPKTIPLMSSAQWQRTYLTAYANANAQRPANDQIAVPTGVQTLSGVNTDWQDAIFQSGAIQNYNVTASGGTPNASYLISGSALDQDGTVLNTNFRRYSLRVNTQASRGRLTVGENLAVSQARTNSFPNGIFGGSALPLIDVVSLLPSIPVRDTLNPGGYGYGSAALPNYGTNPVGVLERNYNRRRSNQVLGTAFGEVRLVRNLRYRLNLGVNYDDALNTVWTGSQQVRFTTPVLTGASLNQIIPTSTNLLYENLLNYDDAFGGGAHRITAVAGQTSQRNQFQQTTAFRQGFADEDLQNIDAGSTTGFNNSGYQIPFRTNSVLGRATYAFKDRYLLTASARRDCSSRFSPGNRCGTFGAGSVGYVVSDERFFRGIPGVGSVPFVKLRASYGVLGDQNIGDLAYFARVQQNVNYLQNNTTVVVGATQTALANTDLRWQRNRSADVGIDFGLFNNALTITTDYYSNVADQVLVNVPLPPSLASASNPAVNAGKVKNAGFELGATHRLDRGGFQLNSSLNLTTTANRVVTLGNGGQPIPSGLFDVARTTVGLPIGSFYVKRTAGIFQSAAEVQNYKNSKGVVIQPQAQPGDLKFVDLNDDGQITNGGDRTSVGSPIPKLTTGLFFDSRYRAFDVGLNFRGAFGGRIYNAVKLATENTVGLNNLREGFNPWSPTNTNTGTPRAVFGEGYSASNNGDPVSDRWIEKGDFVRVQNLIVGYTLSEGVAQRLRLTGAQRPRVYVNAQNLYTFTGYSGYDPEVLGFGNPLARGIDDGFIYPNARTVSFGVDLRF